MDLRTRFAESDDTELFETIVDAVHAKVRTAIPVRVSEDSADGHTVKLQALVKARMRQPDGSEKLVSLPPLADVPIHYPSGGGSTFTHPVKKGDEGMILLADRSIDAWHAQGGEQQPMDGRMHSLSDGFYISGARSNPRKLPKVSQASSQMRSDDGKHVFDMHPQNGPSMSADEGKHVVSAHPKNGIGITTNTKLAIKAKEGLDVEGAAHFKDAVTSAKSFGAPSLRGTTSPFTGMMMGFLGALFGAGAMVAAQAMQVPENGARLVRYALAVGTTP